jgi:hypothetical protein
MLCRQGIAKTSVAQVPGSIVFHKHPGQRA